jgi:transcriptional regulator with XRE-family HTH domain
MPGLEPAGRGVEVTEAAVRGTGIGPALRQARQLRGKSIEEVSRETHIRPEHLQALERERFESLSGDVYVRGFLRSYSTYLGLDADKVVTIFNRHFGPPRPTLPDPAPGPVRSHRSVHPPLPLAHRRHHPSWTFLIVVAISAMAILGAAGLLSRTRNTPRSEAAPAVRPSISVLPPSVVVGLFANGNVSARILADGKVVYDDVIREGQGLSYEGSSRIEVQLDRGGMVKITVNGHSIGTPGTRKVPYSESFGPLDYRRTQSASPGP